MKKLRSILITSLFISTCMNFAFASPKNVLIEYITGTWCGNCPCGHQTLNTISSMYPRTIIIAYHAFNSDPWKNFNGNEIVGLLGYSVTPTAGIDRNNTVSNGNYQQWIEGVHNRYASLPESRVDINVVSKSFNEITRELNLTVNSTALIDLNGQYKITFVITENNLIYPQNFYSNCGTPGIVQDYEHDHVTRTIINGAQGEALNSGSFWNSNQIFTKSVSTVLDPSWNPTNCKIIAFVNKSESVFSLSMVEQAIEENVTGSVGIHIDPSEIPEIFSLSQNYPNPFNPSTHLEFGISNSGFVSLKVYDVLGKEIKTLVNEIKPAGIYSMEFDGSDLPGGIYFYRLISGNFSQVRKMILLK